MTLEQVFSRSPMTSMFLDPIVNSQSSSSLTHQQHLTQMTAPSLLKGLLNLSFNLYSHLGFFLFHRPHLLSLLCCLLLMSQPGNLGGSPKLSPWTPSPLPLDSLPWRSHPISLVNICFKCCLYTDNPHIYFSSLDSAHELHTHLSIRVLDVST